MSRRIALIALAVALGPEAVRAQDAKKDRPAAAPAVDPLEGAKPGPEHKELAQLAGSWNVEITMGLGGAPMVYRGTATNRMTVGGRFLLMEYQSKHEADPLDGMFLIGFDRRHQRFELSAMDTFGTYSVSSRGKREGTERRIRMLGTDDDPMMKAMGFTKEFVHVLDLGTADAFAVEVWFVDTRTPERREMKAMTFRFRRKS